MQAPDVVNGKTDDVGCGNTQSGFLFILLQLLSSPFKIVSFSLFGPCALAIVDDVTPFDTRSTVLSFNPE